MTGKGGNVSGLAGIIHVDGLIEDSFASGAVVSIENVGDDIGALVGYSRGTIITFQL